MAAMVSLNTAPNAMAISVARDFIAEIQKVAGIPALILAFPWRISLGTFVTFLVSICFGTGVRRPAETALASFLAVGNPKVRL